MNMFSPKSFLVSAGSASSHQHAPGSELVTEETALAWFEAQVADAPNQPFGIKTVTVMVTPALARVLLDRNPLNRALKRHAAEDYMSEIREGRWQGLNGQTIVVSNCGLVNDGQHRLLAITKVGIPQPMQICFGPTRESRETLDIPVVRRSADIVEMTEQGEDGEKVYGAIRTAIAGIMLAFDKSNGRLTQMRTPKTLVVSKARDPQVLQAAKEASKLAAFMHGQLSPAQVGAALIILSRVNQAKAVEFLTQVCIGENISRGDPAFATRHALSLLKGKTAQPRIEALMRGFIAFHQGQSRQIIKVLGTLPEL